MVFNGYRQATVAAVFETPAKTSFLFDLDGTLVWSTASISRAGLAVGAFGGGNRTSRSGASIARSA
jgi:hypothetical protein